MVSSPSNRTVTKISQESKVKNELRLSFKLPSPLLCQCPDAESRPHTGGLMLLKWV